MGQTVVAVRGYTLSDVTPPIRLPVRVCREAQHSNSTKMGRSTSALKTDQDSELVLRGKTHAECHLSGQRSAVCFPPMNSFGHHVQFRAEALRPILVEIECCVSRQTRTGNLVGGVTSLGAVVLGKCAIVPLRRRRFSSSLDVHIWHYFLV